MTDERGAARVFEFDAFGVSTGLAVVCGALSVLVPVLTAGAATLTALGLTSWVSLTRRKASSVRTNFGAGTLVALGILGGMGAVFLVSPPLLTPYRGLLLALGLVPLALVERRRSIRCLPTFGAS